ncbi:PREDICTED: pentatricopeptide repeat-containing protein At4g01570 [Tarenaya hassleriana]|uniref:pentatricopeptide repeat-containing protein At4g01570 n=1 Tax=Tarenaya hassleriana TaxID=28532 RepID=UPI00053C9E9B|nr:PREDICTED: pentatricopeptide repeat-containing protein At4g01570 [Tarenaya hassleriana]
MRHGRTKFISAAAFSGLSPAKIPPQQQVCDVLVVAYLAKNLSLSGTRNLDSNSLPISESLVLQILRRISLELSRRLDFFRWCSSLRPSYKHSAAAYSQIFRTVCRAGLLGEVPGLLGLMKEDGVVLDQETSKVLLDSLVRSAKFDTALEILDYMEELGTDLSHKLYDSVLVALVRKNQVGLALSIFFKLLQESNNHCDDPDGGGSSFSGSVALNELLVGLRKAGMRSEFKQVFGTLREMKGFKFDTWGYNICIYAFGCWGDLDTALSLFREMKEQGSVSGTSAGPDVCTYNSLLHVLCLLGKVKDALIVWDELKVSGHEPDAFTYRIVIQGCTKSYRMEDAMKVFSEMQYSGFAPDTVVYNSLLDGMLKARKITEACQLFETMVQEGVRASCWTYNILIDGLFRNGRAEAGYTLFCDLKKKGQFVDAITYSIVALQLCREAKLEGAIKLVEEMEARGFLVDLVTISSLLIAIHKQGRWDWTERLMKHVREGNLVPHVLRWKAEMEASLRSPQSREKDYTPMFPSKGNFIDIMTMMGPEEPSSSVDETSHVEEDDDDPWSSSPYMDQLSHQSNQPRTLFALTRGQRVQAKGTDSFDIDMINTFLSIFLSKGDISLACKLFEIFNNMGETDPTSYTYNSMMSSFVKKGYFKTAYGVLEQMGEKFCPADIATYNVIIQGLGKMGRADLASSVLDRLTKQGGYLDIVMYNTLMNALGKAGRVDEANGLFEQMKRSGINPDVVSYNTMIQVHSKAGRLKDAYKFLKMMLDAGCSPNHVTDTILDYLGKEMEKSRFKKASFVRSDTND